MENPLKKSFKFEICNSQFALESVKESRKI